MRTLLSILILIFSILFIGCDSEQMQSSELNREPVFEPTAFKPELPDKFPPLQFPDDNPLTEEGIELGRMLFYDPILDADSARSCATCHQQKYAFSSPDHEQHGLDVGIMPHINLAWDRIFLWNGEVEGTIEDIMLFEVSKFFQTDLDRMNNHPTYPGLFRKAFGVDKINHDYIAKALAQFERTMISGNSKFDKFIREEVQLTEQEYRGFNLFYSEDGDCFHCHGTVLFKDNLAHNNGINSVFEGIDLGHFLISGDSMDIGRFKAPTLRNIELTAPYMHDNRYANLKEVLDFYSDHVNFTPFTDPLMNHEGGINLTDAEKEDLIAFLKTLTDTSFINNPNLSNPFNQTK